MIVAQTRGRQQEGFLLLALVVVMFLIALFLTIAAPTVARSLERDRELESEHRAQQYVRAIHNYYLKFNSYPTSVDALLNQNNQHFLRQQYKDPLTGGEYRLIHFGEAKTKVKGFFGEPLDGFQQGSLGALAGNASGIGTGVGGAAGSPAAGGAGSTGTFGTGFRLGTSGAPPSQGPSGGIGAAPGTGSGTAAGAASSAGSTGSGVSATQFQGSKGMIVGVGSTASGRGLVEWNGSAAIEDWEFLYDHRTWLLRQRVSIFGGSAGQGGSPGAIGGASGTSAGSFGSFGTSSGTTAPPGSAVGSPATPTTPGIGTGPGAGSGTTPP